MITGLRTMLTITFISMVTVGLLLCPGPKAEAATCGYPNSPKTGTMIADVNEWKTCSTMASLTPGGEFIMTLSNMQAGSQLPNGLHGSYCVDLTGTILDNPQQGNIVYTVDFWSSLDPNLPNAVRQVSHNAQTYTIPWDKINYLLNTYPNESWLNLQAAYWDLVHGCTQLPNSLYTCGSLRPVTDPFPYGPAAPYGCPSVPQIVSEARVQFLVNEANSNGGGFKPKAGDRIASVGQITNCSPTATCNQHLPYQVFFIPTTCPTCTGTVGDVVWEDLNGNGVQDAGEPGIKNVEVKLAGTDAYGEAVNLTTTTDANGKYQFNNLCAASYQVTVNALTVPAGLTATINRSSDGNDNNPIDSNEPAGTSVKLSTDSGSNLTVDFGYEPDCKGSIGDFVWLDKDGNSRQDTGEPGIPNVTVKLDGTNTYGVPVHKTSITDSTGLYGFHGLCQGEYTVTVDNNTVPANYAPTSPASPSGDDLVTDDSNQPAGTTVQLSSDTFTNPTVDFGYVPLCSGTAGDFVWKDLNQNGIQDSEEPGIAGVVVNLGGTNAYGKLVSMSATTDSNGRYAFNGLCAGRYTATVNPSTVPSGWIATAPTKADSTDGNITVPNDAVDGNNPNGTIFTLTDDFSTNRSIDFGYVPNCTATIGDYVWQDNFNGIQDDGSSSGIDGIQILLTGTNVYGQTVNVSDTTKHGGYYQFSGLCQGEYTVAVNTAGTTALGLIPTQPRSGNGSDGAGNDSNEPAGTSVIVSSDSITNLTVDFGFFLPRPAITLLKLTNGVDAPSVTGPVLTVGSPVTWSYIATNTGNVELSGVTITDDKISISCSPVTLAVGASTTCTATGIAAAGQYVNTGTATGSYGSTSVSASYPSHYLGVTPAISIRKQEKGADTRTFATGSDVNFEIEVKNIGDTVLTNVSVSDPLTPSCAATFASLVVGESKLYACTATNVTQGFTNTVTVTGTYDNKSCTDSDVSTVAVVKPAITIRKQAKGADSRTFATGSDVNFEIEVKNIGDTVLTNVSVSDPLTPSCAATFASLAVGEIKLYTCTAINVTEGFTNTATVSGTYDNKNYTDSDVSTVIVVKPAITIRKQAKGEDSRTFATGSNVPFEIEVKNIGDTVLTNVIVADPLTPTCAATFASLAVGESKLYTCTATNVTQGFTNTATVTGTYDNKSYTDSDNSTVVVVKPAITIRKQAKGEDSRTFATGSNVPFEIEVKNIGDSVLTNVIVADPLTPSCAATFASLAVGETKLYTCTATNVTQGFTNTVTVTGSYDNKSYTDSDNSTVVVVNPAISIKKLTNSIDAPTGTGPNLTIGSAVTWTYIVSNAGNVPLDNVKVTDNKLTGITCPGTTLLVGASMTCTATGTATAGQYENTGTATANANGITVTSSYLSHYFGISAPSASGCTYTQGFWKNHGEKWPCASLSLGKTSYTKEQLLSIFQTPVQGNGLISLAHQLIAAKLNLKNGAGLTPELQTAIDYADALIKYLVVPPVGTGYLAPANTSTLETILDTYNSGLAFNGPAHCQDAPSVTCTGSIGNLVWKDLNANGLQDTGETGISGLTITLTDNLTGAKKTTSTDTGGSYSFTGLCAGTYTVSVATPSGLAPSVVAQGIDREKDSNGSPATVLLPTDSYNDNSVDFGFYPTTCSGSIGDRVWSDANNNGIQDSGEAGIAGVSVLLKKNGVNFATTTTDANGLYKFNALCAASYTVTVSAPAGYTPSATVKGTDRAKDSNANPAAVTLSTNSSSDLSIDFGYYRAAVCTGSIGNYVWSDFNINGLQEACEPGIQGVIVKLTNTSNGVTTVTTTDTTGKYQFSGLCSGNYTVTVSTPAGFTASPVNSGSDRTIDSNSASSPVSLSSNSSADITVDFGFYKTPTPPQATGCSLGYWKTHTSNWPSTYHATDNFDTVFGANAFSPDITMLQALQKGGGGLSKLARQGAAALLNAQDNRMTGFPMSISEVKSAVLNAIQTGSYEPLASQLDTFNNLGCPLN